jgi:integrase
MLSAGPSTRLGYACALQRHILPALGKLKLTDISPLYIENLIKTKLNEKSALSPKTVLNLLRLLQGIFSVAVDNDLIPRSPVRRKHVPHVPKSEKPRWTPEQVRAILDEVPANYRPVFVCLALTGIRAGELLGLQRKYVSVERRVVRIEQSLWNQTSRRAKNKKQQGLDLVRRMCWLECWRNIVKTRDSQDPRTSYSRSPTAHRSIPTCCVVTCYIPRSIVSAFRE